MKQRMILPLILLFCVSALSPSLAAQSKPSSDNNSRHDCPQWKIDMVYAWSEQLVADEDSLRQLKWKELEQRKTYANACIVSIARAEDPKKELSDDDPHTLAFLFEADMVIRAVMAEEMGRLVNFLEKKGLEQEFESSSAMMHG